MPDMYGSTTFSAAAVATAASMALPPCWRIRSPAPDASGCAEETIPRRPIATGRYAVPRFGHVMLWLPPDRVDYAIWCSAAPRTEVQGSQDEASPRLSRGTSGYRRCLPPSSALEGLRRVPPGLKPQGNGE